MIRDLKAYMGAVAYIAINNDLRAGLLQAAHSQKSDQTYTDGATDLEKTVLRIDEDLDTLGKPLAAHTLVYRKGGINNYCGQLAVGGIFVDHAYLSGSQNTRYSWAHNADHGSGTVWFTIRTIALGYGRDCVEVRKNYAEQEVVFHRNVRFQVTQIDQELAPKSNTHFHMDEIASPDAGFVWGAHRT